MKYFSIFFMLMLFLQIGFSQTTVVTTGEEETANPDSLVADDKNDLPVPVVTLSSSELEGDDDSQDISGLLTASHDVFVSTAGFTLSAARFRIRGYESENSLVMINGTPVNDVESGRAFWSAWGGLNDATRNKVSTNGLASAENSFSRLGGSTDILTRAASYRKGVRATYSVGNKSYRNRVMVTWASGMLENGLSVVMSGSKRWSEEGYASGTFYDAYAYFLSVEKKISESQSLNFTFFGSPTTSGKQGGSVQEVYDLTGNNYYNSYWGYQNGKKRNSRVSTYHKPMLMLNHYIELNDKTKLTTGLSYSFGRGGSTALNWYDGSYASDLNVPTGMEMELAGSDPRPDYYRYLPSYYDEENPQTADTLAHLWETNPYFRQVNWDYFYFANKKNLFSVDNANGNGETLTGNRSKYIVEERRNDHGRTTLNSVLTKKINDHLTCRASINVDRYKGFHFKEIVDLLGGDFFVDIDQFAERDFEDPTMAQSDLTNPNRTVGVGDRFGYDYTANINTQSLFGQGDFSYGKIDFFASATASFIQFWRTGNMQTGKWPDNSLGDSEKQTFFNYGIKGGATYKLTGRHLININAVYMTRAPYFSNAYLSPRSRDHVVKGLTNETIYSGDASYYYRSPFLVARLTGYYTDFKDQIFNMSFYHEELRTFVNYIMTDVDLLNQGIELGLEVKPTSTISIIGVFAKEANIINSRPNVTIVADNGNALSADSIVYRTSYLKNYKQGGSPMTAGSVGARYFSPKYWSAGFNVNYFADFYIEANPERRTENALDGVLTTDPQWTKVLEQEKLPAAYTVDIYCNKSWQVKKYRINVNLSINNLLNKTDIISGGYESLRYSAPYANLHPDDILKFKSTYFYMYGRTYFINVGFSF